MQFKKKQTKRLTIEITPLIDVIFLLLIFFMVSTTFIKNPGIKVKLPEASQKPKSETPKIIKIAITSQNKVYLDGKSIRLGDLKNLIQKKSLQKKVDSLVINADGDVRHQLVVSVMDAAKQAGIKKLSIGTSYKQ